MSRRAKTGIAALLIVFLLMLGGAGYVLTSRSGFRDSRVVRKAPETFAIYYTCDTRGHIEPCSCSEGIAGGVARRKAYLTAQPATPSLLVDAGNVTAGPRPWERVELSYILKAYAQMDYDAVNAGPREATLEIDDLRKAAADYDRLVSANLLDVDGKPVLPPYRIALLEGGYRVGIMGVVDDALSADEIGKGLTVAPPEDAVAKYLPEVKAKADFVVLLAFTNEERMKALAERFYEIDVIVGGDVEQPSGTPVEANRSLIVYVTDKGKGVGRLELALQPDGKRVVRNDIHILTEEVTPDPEMAALLEAYTQEITEIVDSDAPELHDDEEGLTNISSSARSLEADTFAGADACRDCHPNAYDTWLHSAHARAFATLASRDAQDRAECLPCHTVAFGASDGFVAAAVTPLLKDVTCEACHGRAAHHAALELGKPVPVKRVFMRTVECETCHDARNSPKFARAEYWEKIKHDRS